MQSVVEFKSKDRHTGHFHVEYGPGNAEILPWMIHCVHTTERITIQFLFEKYKKYNNIVRNLTVIVLENEDLFSFNSVRTHINSSSTSPGQFFTTNLQFGLSGEILISFVPLMCNAFIIWILVSFPAVAVYRQRRGQCTKLRNCPILPFAALKVGSLL